MGFSERGEREGGGKGGCIKGEEGGCMKDEEAKGWRGQKGDA